MAGRPRVWIGVDLGTGSVRALAVGDDGAVRHAAARALSSTRGRGRHGGSRHEQDPRSWVESTVAAVGEVAAALDPATVAGLAVDATSGTVVLADGPGPDAQFLTPGVMYDDDRGAAHAARAQDVGDEVWTRLGHRVGATWALPTAMAMLAEHPGAHLRHQVDVVTAALVGAPVATDASNALKTGYDALARRWPVEVLAELGLDPDTLPAVVAPGTTLGGLGARTAEETGLPAGLPVIAGMTDGCAAQLGAGAVAPGQWNTVLGTTLIVKGVCEHLLRDPAGSLYSHRAPQGGWWLPGGASSTGAGVLTGVAFPDATGPRLDELTAAAREVPEASVPVVYPLAAQGERFPFVAGQARGFWLDGGRARPLDELVDAVGAAAAFAGLCEGVALVERACLERVAALGVDVSGRRTITGGATANPWWNQVRADVAGVALHRPASAEPAFGMAVLARAGVDAAGGPPDVVTAAHEMVRIVETIEPRPRAGVEDRRAALHAAWRELGWLG